jgi:hypothetical protein
VFIQLGSAGRHSFDNERLCRLAHGSLRFPPGGDLRRNGTA